MFYVFIALSLFNGILADIEYDNRLQISLEHALEDTLSPVPFQFRGEINIKSLHSGSASLDQIRLTSQEISSLKNLALKNEMYRIKATVKTPDNRQSIFYTSTPACALLESNFHDIFYVSLDHIGNVVAVSLATPSSCSYSGELPSLTDEFNTSVYVKHMELGPVPDTASYIQKIEREREAKDRGETKDNRSFIAKYWMYIIPVVIFLLLSGANNSEGGGGQ